MRSPQSNDVGWRDGNRAKPIEIWKARNFIHEHSDEELSLTQVARAVNISGNHLSETRVNFVGYIACVGFEKARSLLRAQVLTAGMLRASGPPESQAR